MKITGNNPFTKVDTYVKNIGRDKGKASASSRESSKGAPSTVDRVVLSSKAQEIHEMKKLLNSIPDIREGKVAQIKERIENGTYEIDGKKIALKMIKESLLNELL